MIDYLGYIPKGTGHLFFSFPNPTSRSLKLGEVRILQPGEVRSWLLCISTFRATISSHQPITIDLSLSHT